MRLIGVALVVWSATGFAAPGGRVVRVERSGGFRVAPRLCEIRGDTGNCLGEQPVSGQTVVVIDEHRVIAEVQIVEATSFSPSCPTLWAVKTRLVRGTPGDSDGVGVIDPNLDIVRARLLERSHMPASPSGFADEEVWRAIDRDGDGAADILLTRFGCDSQGRPAPGGSNFCIDVWARTGTRMTRTTELNFGRCNR
ncbi:MAG: hypothetical protein E6J90_50805 [Deltaproteobacteria bacterium]|nr:MAG: hypothetical protein E6J90_50805 [Deltaproteobacteria bacterium]